METVRAGVPRLPWVPGSLLPLLSSDYTLSELQWPLRHEQNGVVPFALILGSRTDKNPHAGQVCLTNMVGETERCSFGQTQDGSGSGYLEVCRLGTGRQGPLTPPVAREKVMRPQEGEDKWTWSPEKEALYLFSGT